MRISAGGSIVLAFCLVTSARAQQADQPVSVESVRLALQKAPQASLLTSSALSWIGPTPTRFGIFTFVPPDTRGGLVKVTVPVGNLVSRAASAVSSVQRRHAERNAHEEVVRALQAFQAQRPSR